MSDLSLEDAAGLVDLPRSDRVFRLFDFDPFPYQAAVLDCEEPSALWLGGRQSGKTEASAAIPADYALMNPGEDALVCARYQNAADELFRRTKAHLAEMGSLPAIGVESPNKREYELDTGGRILSRTIGTDGSQLRGLSPGCIVVEEAALVSTDVFEKVIQPMQATHSDPELLLVSTPRGKSGLVWDLWNSAETNDEWARFRNTTADSPLVSDDWLRAKREEVDSTTWRQEYCAKFVTTGNAYLSPETVRPCVRDEPPERTGERAWLGVDIARSGRDRSVYVSIDDEGNVFDVVAVDEETLTQAVGRIKNLHERHGYAGILIDENGVGGGAVDFSSADLPNVEPVTFSSKSKQELYVRLKKALESEDLALPPNETLVSELESLTFDFTQQGILRVKAVSGGHDDHADALALAVRGWQQRQSQPRHVVRRGNPQELLEQRREGDDADNSSSSVRRRSPYLGVHNRETKSKREKQRDIEKRKRDWWSERS